MVSISLPVWFNDIPPKVATKSIYPIAIAKDGTPMIGNLSSWDAYDYPKKLAKFVTEKFYDKKVNNEKFHTELIRYDKLDKAHWYCDDYQNFMKQYLFILTFCRL